MLLARVTQIKIKGGMRYVGVATGMNSLIRPALYGAHHEIVNLTRLGEPANGAGERRRADLRERGRPRPRPAAAGVPRGRRDADRERGRLRPRDGLELQPARAGGRAADLVEPGSTRSGRVRELPRRQVGAADSRMRASRSRYSSRLLASSVRAWPSS